MSTVTIRPRPRLDMPTREPGSCKVRYSSSGWRKITPSCGSMLFVCISFLHARLGLTDFADGAGKTVLASTIINHLLDLKKTSPAGAYGVAYFYCDYRET